MMARAATVRMHFLGLAALLSAAMAARADEPKGTRWIGPEAMFYAESSRPSDLLDRVLSDRVSGLLKVIPNYEATLNRQDVKTGKGVVDFVARSFGTTWDDGLRDLAGGGIVVGVEGKEKPERAILVVTPRNLDLLEKVHAKVLELVRSDAKVKAKPDPVTESEHRGIKTYSLSPLEAHAIVDGALVVTNGPETLKAVIDRSTDAKSPALADLPLFSARHKEKDPEALAWAFARTDRLRKIDPKRYGGNKPDAGATFLFGAWLEAIQKGDWATLGLTWTEGRLAAELTVATPKEGYSPAMKRYLPGQGEGAPRPISPPHVIASAALWRDFASIWEVRADIFTPETVQGLAQLDTQAGTFFGGRDFGTGVLGALGGRWSVVVADQDFDKLTPAPDLKLPAFAVILDLKPDDPEFATRLMSAFQSFLGLVNLGAAQTKAPPLMIGSDQMDGLAIATSRYSPETGRPKGEPINSRHNFTPSAVQVGNYFVISSSLGLARDLVKTLKEPIPATDSTLLAEADGPALARLLDRNRATLVTQNMLTKGNPKAQAEAETNLLLELLKYVGHGTMSVADREGSATLKLNFTLNAK